MTRPRTPGSPRRASSPAKRIRRPATGRKAVPVDLGLQGGGAHGAFTWGVLDRLLEEPWLAFDGISGTSAGAMNAVVMADGLTARRARRRARGAGGVLEARVGRGADEPAAARPARDPDRQLDARLLAGVRRAGHRRARVLALRHESDGRRIRCAQILQDSVDFERLATAPDQAVRHRHQRAHRPRPHLPQRRAHAGRAARVGLPADDVPGGGDRRRALLGRRLLRQSVDVAAGPRVHGVRHDPGADQPDRAARARRARRARSTTG